MSLLDKLSAHSDVVLVRLIRLAPGRLVDEHCNPTLVFHAPGSAIRLTIPVVTNDAVELFLNGGISGLKIPWRCAILRKTRKNILGNVKSKHPKRVVSC